MCALILLLLCLTVIHLQWDLPAVAKAEEADYFTEDVKEVPAESTPWDNISGNQPCLIFLDSLSMHPHAKIGKRLASYVYHERLARRADRELGPDIEEKDFIPLIKIIRCQVCLHPSSFRPLHC